jgi:hypothetical protein
MSLTRAAVETVLIARCGPALTRVGLDGATIDGNNAALADPIRTAMRTLGIHVADPVTPTDADLALVPNVRVETLFDVAERRTLETVLGNAVDVDETVDRDSQKNSQFAAQIERRVAALTEKLAKSVGIMRSGAVVAPITAGVVNPLRVLPGDPRLWKRR